MLIGVSNVERLACIWQDLHPDTTDKRNWIDPTEAGSRRAISETEALVPFHVDTAGKHWRGAEARDWRVMGYTYPELQKWNFVNAGRFDQQAYVNSIYSTVKNLYATTASAVRAVAGGGGIASSGIRAPVLAPHTQEHFSAGGHSHHSHGPEKWEENDYIVNVLYEK